jgi:hypothetical protein
MKTCIVALAVTFFGMATPTDVSGYWYLTLKTSDDKDAPRIEVALQQDGEKLTGNCFIDQADDKFILTGQVKENAINWRCAGTGPVEASFSGTISQTGNEITGSWTTPAPAKGTFTGAKRQQCEC